jgi:hypothetical protein
MTEAKITLQALAFAGTIFFGPAQEPAVHPPGGRCQAAQSTSTAAVKNSTWCLACHDGAVAKNAFPVGPKRSDYSRAQNHPVLVSYEQAHSRKPTTLVAPAALDPKLQLVDGKIQCTTCHVVSAKQEWTTVALAGRRDICLGCHRK